MATKLFPGKHEGTLALWTVDENGEKKGDYPLLCHGPKKFKAILEHSEEIKEFIGVKDDDN